LHVFLNDTQIATLHPELLAYPKLAYPPFLIDLPWPEAERSILRIDGFVGGVQRISRSFDGSHGHDQLWITTDDTHIRADGTDSTRISFGVSDRFGNTRPTAEGVLRVQHTGAGKVVGDLEFPLTESGAVGAVWLRGLRYRSGQGKTTVIHDSLGQKSVKVKIR
jgi:beta-galactosidase